MFFFTLILQSDEGDPSACDMSNDRFIALSYRLRKNEAGLGNAKFPARRCARLCVAAWVIITLLGKGSTGDGRHMELCAAEAVWRCMLTLSFIADINLPCYIYVFWVVPEWSEL